LTLAPKTRKHEFASATVTDHDNGKLLHYPPYSTLDNFKPKLPPILRTGATRLTDLAFFAPQQSRDFVFVANLASRSIWRRPARKISSNLGFDKKITPWKNFESQVNVVELE
jgi:hypothetical protein